MSPPTEHRMAIFDDRTGDGEHYKLTAIVKDTGDLVLEGYDIGRSVETFKGDIDYEYWRTVAAEHVPLVLLHLIKDRFKDEAEFRTWLEEKGIPSSYMSY